MTPFIGRDSLHRHTRVCVHDALESARHTHNADVTPFLGQCAGVSITADYVRLLNVSISGEANPHPVPLGGLRGFQDPLILGVT